MENVFDYIFMLKMISTVLIVFGAIKFVCSLLVFWDYNIGRNAALNKMKLALENKRITRYGFKNAFLMLIAGTIILFSIK